MIPKFSVWVENTEEISSDSQQTPKLSSGEGVSEPQHKKGEESLTLNKLIEKRLSEIIEELTRKGKANKDEVLGSIKYFLDKLPKNESPKPSSPPPQGQAPSVPTQEQPPSGAPQGQNQQ